MSRCCSPSWIETYLKFTQFQESPGRFHLWVALYMLAAAVGRKVHIDKFYYKLYPNLYVALVGPSAAVKKTTAGDISLDLITAVPSINHIDGKITAWDFFLELGKLCNKLGAAEASVYASEAKDLFGDLGKAELVTMLTRLYTCPAKFTHRTVKHGTVDIINVFINLLICSTPEWLVTGIALDDMAAGWTGRFIYVFEESCDRSFAFPEDYITSDIRQLKQDLITDLQEIALASGEFMITPQAKAEYLIWYNHRKDEWKDERLMGYYGRKPDMVWKVAMLLSLSVDNALVIDESTLRMAWQLLHDLEANMAKALAHVVGDPALRHKDKTLSFILNSPGHRATRTEVLKKFWTSYDSDILDRIIKNCVECRLIHTYSAMTKGQSEIVYEIVDTTTKP